MIFDFIWRMILGVWDWFIDILPDPPFQAFFDWLPWDEYADFIGNVMYFFPVDLLIVFFNFVLPIAGICIVVGGIRLIWDILPFT